MSTATAPSPQHSLPPSAQMMQLLFGKHVTYCLSAVARLGVPDHMSNDPAPIEQLAAKTGSHAPSLYRVMRVLGSIGVFAEASKGHFALTPLGATLRTDDPQSMRYAAMMMGDSWTTRPFELITESVRTGEEAVSKVFGKNIFEHLGNSPEEADHFHRAMTNVSSLETMFVVASYDFSGIRRLADVGGGHGYLLKSILDKNAAMQGVLYDLPGVVSGAQPRDRMTIESGSFFDRVPSGCDAFIMKHIIHDWSDEKCIEILRLMRAQLPADGRILVCEMVVSDEPVPEMGKFLDIEMLVLTHGGKERTESEFRDLFARARLRLNRIVRSDGPMCVVEAVPA